MRGTPTRITADSVIGVSGKPTRIYHIELDAGPGVGTLNLRNGTSASATRLVQVEAEADAIEPREYAKGVFFPEGCFADLEGSVDSAVVWWEAVTTT